MLIRAPEWCTFFNRGWKLQEETWTRHSWRIFWMLRFEKHVAHFLEDDCLNIGWSFFYLVNIVEYLSQSEH